MENVLKMPRSFVEVKDDEMEYVEGSSLWVAIAGYAIAVIGVILAVPTGGVSLAFAAAGAAIATYSLFEECENKGIDTSSCYAGYGYGVN